MKNSKELMKEINKRKSVYIMRKQIRRLAVIGSGIAVLLVAMIFLAPQVTGNMQQHVADKMGATILGPEIGGYVIVALLAFSLGIVVARLIQKYQTIKKQGDNEREDGGDSHS